MPRKSSGESSSKWAVACGIILFVAITLTVGLCFHHHKKSPKHGVNNCSCKTLAMDDSPLFIKSNKNEFGVWSWEIHAKKIKRSKHCVTATTASVKWCLNLLKRLIDPVKKSGTHFGSLLDRPLASKICLSVNYILTAHGGHKAHSRNFMVITFHALIETVSLFPREEQSPVI